MRTAIMSLSFITFAMMLAHSEEFDRLSKYEQSSSYYYRDPSPQKLFDMTKAEHITVTAYTDDPKENWGGLSISAFGTKLTPGTIAVSRDLYKKGWKQGKKVYVHGYGIFTVNDKMHHRHRNKIDILVSSKKAADDFGVKQIKAILLSEAK